jgi:hypothetical protein
MFICMTARISLQFRPVSAALFYLTLHYLDVNLSSSSVMLPLPPSGPRSVRSSGCDSDILGRAASTANHTRQVKCFILHEIGQIGHTTGQVVCYCSILVIATHHQKWKHNGDPSAS